MCKKREEMALVGAIVEMSGRSTESVRQLLADSVHLARHTCRACKVPLPQHLVENLCVTSFSMNCRADTPRELTRSTLNFLGML